MVVAHGKLVRGLWQDICTCKDGALGSSKMDQTEDSENLTIIAPSRVISVLPTVVPTLARAVAALFATMSLFQVPALPLAEAVRVGDDTAADEPPGTISEGMTPPISSINSVSALETDKLMPDAYGQERTVRDKATGPCKPFSLDARRHSASYAIGYLRNSDDSRFSASWSMSATDARIWISDVSISSGSAA